MFICKGGAYILVAYGEYSCYEISVKGHNWNIFFPNMPSWEFLNHGALYTATPLRMKKMIAESTAAAGTVITHAAMIFFTIPRFT